VRVQITIARAKGSLMFPTTSGTIEFLCSRSLDRCPSIFPFALVRYDPFAYSTGQHNSTRNSKADFHDFRVRLLCDLLFDTTIFYDRGKFTLIELRDAEGRLQN
jgi:hypothetical protein